VPDAAVAVCIQILPDFAVSADDAMLTEPPINVPVPLVMTKLPPVAVPNVVDPANTLTDPPLPAFVLPKNTPMDPEEPPVATPVDKAMDPGVPPPDVPVRMRT
jgi:hypothetical protein